MRADQRQKRFSAGADPRIMVDPLNNWRRHREDRASFAKNWKVDPFSSGVQFTGWKELESSPIAYRLPSTYQPLFVWRPKTWLLTGGLEKHALISVYEVPGPQK